MPAPDRRLEADTHRALARLAVRFGTRAHIAWLAEAHTAARAAPDDPLAALELLTALQGTPYASRPKPRAALADIGGWLEDHHRDHPHLTADRLTVELGWLRRLAIAQDKLVGGVGQPSRTPRRFGQTLRALRARRAPDEAPEPPPPPTTAPPQPSPPPTHYAAGLFNALAARDVWKTIRKRLKANKPFRDKRVPLAARTVDPAPAFEASFTQTAGLIDLFRAFDAGGGQIHDFYITAWDDTATPWLATAISTADPDEQP